MVEGEAFLIDPGVSDKDLAVNLQPDSSMYFAPELMTDTQAIA